MVEKSTREEEEKYFQAESAEKKNKLRRRRQLEAVRQKEREGIAAALNTNEECAEEALNLGFDAETARILPLVPMIQIAWADGRVTGAELSEVEETAEKYGLKEGTAAHQFLMMLLEERPTDFFFQRVNQVISHIVEEDPQGDVGSNVLGWSKAVAEASGGFFGLTNPISKKEQKILDEFAVLFGLNS